MSGGAEDSGGTWHQALAYAVTGRRLTLLGHQSAPSVRQLARELVDEVGAETLAADVHHRMERGQAWPHPVPADLTEGLGPAQFAAALLLLKRELGLDGTGAPLPRVGAAQPTTPGERRLLDEVPPHHGS